MLTALRSSPAPSYAPPPPRTPPTRPSSPSSLFARRPSSPALIPPPPPSPEIYRAPFRRNSLSAPSSAAPPPRPASPSHSPQRSIRTSSPARPRSILGAPPAPGGCEVFGDSFCSVFSLATSLKVHRFPGASARGLNNPSSTLAVGPEILKRIEAARPSTVVLVFGHVDLACNYLWQLKAKGAGATGPADWVQRVASDYAAFLATKIVPLAKRMGITVFVAGVTPPVVEDRYLELSSQKYLEREGVGPLPPLSAARHPHDLTTRAWMVSRLNALLSSFCARHSSLRFVDISRQLVSSADPRRVASRFVDRQDPTNIHICWESTIDLWCRAIPPLRNLAPQDMAPSMLFNLL
ncbi:hypothetical protein JCM8097_003383 [Rhodosporidiobolus ruineniae]